MSKIQVDETYDKAETEAPTFNLYGAQANAR